MSELVHDVRIELPSGLRLEASFWRPNKSSGNQANKLAVCLHPWSWLGGRKDDPALSLLVEPLLAKSYHIIQYNSRGVGRSSGWSSFTGFSEAKDLQDVVNWATEKLAVIQSLLIVGYSHGSLIASMFPVMTSVKTSHLLLSYPFGPRSWLTLFNSSTYAKALNEILQHPESNVLVIFGDKDEFTSQSSYKAWTSNLEGNVEIAEITGGSHFWHGRSGQELVKIVSNWLP